MIEILLSRKYFQWHCYASLISFVFNWLITLVSLIAREGSKLPVAVNFSFQHGKAYFVPGYFIINQEVYDW